MSQPPCRACHQGIDQPWKRGSFSGMAIKPNLCSSQPLICQSVPIHTQKIPELITGEGLAGRGGGLFHDFVSVMALDYQLLHLHPPPSWIREVRMVDALATTNNTSAHGPHNVLHMRGISCLAFEVCVPLYRHT